MTTNIFNPVLAPQPSTEQFPNFGTFNLAATPDEAMWRWYADLQVTVLHLTQMRDRQRDEVRHAEDELIEAEQRLAKAVEWLKEHHIKLPDPPTTPEAGLGPPGGLGP